MKFGTYLEYILTYCFLSGMHCTTVERYYKSSQNITYSVNYQYQTKLTTKSRTECSVACTEESTCNSFSFKKKSGVCSMSSGIAENVSDRVYFATSVCPFQLGYTLWTYAGVTLCLKYVSSSLQHDGAVASCAADNAHLVVIDGDSARLLVVDMLTALGAGSSLWDYVYVDGYDYGNQNIFRTWKTDVIWSSWFPGDPHHRAGEDCIVGALYAFFQTSDAYCSARYSYVCQTDLI